MNAKFRGVKPSIERYLLRSVSIVLRRMVLAEIPSEFALMSNSYRRREMVVLIYNTFKISVVLKVTYAFMLIIFCLLDDVMIDSHYPPETFLEQAAEILSKTSSPVNT